MVSERWKVRIFICQFFQSFWNYRVNPTKTVDLQTMRVTTMLRFTRVSLLIGWYNKIRITLSTVASTVNIKPSRKRLFSVF